MTFSSPSSSDLAAAFPLAADAQDLLFRDARTPYAFTDEPVDPALIHAVVDLVRWAPTSANTQPMRLLLIPQGPDRERLVPHMLSDNGPKVGDAPLVAIVAADTDFHLEMPRLLPENPGFAGMFAANPELRVSFSRDNAMLQAAYLILGLRAAGLGVAPMGGFVPPAVDGEFFAGSSWRSVLILNVGYAAPDGLPPRQARLAPEEIIRSL